MEENTLVSTNNPIDVVIPSTGASVQINSNTNHDYADVVGFFIESSATIPAATKIDNLFIDNKKVVENILIKNFVPSSQNDRTYKDVSWSRRLRANGSRVSGQITDGGGGSYPYTITIQLLCTTKE